MQIKQQHFYATLAGDEVPAIIIWNTNPSGAKIVRGSSKWQFFAADGTTADTSVNTGGTTDGEITDTEAATLGALAALINADTDHYWHAVIAAGFYDSAPANLIDITSTTVTTSGITTGTGAKGGGAVWDNGKAGVLVRPVACFGPEGDTDLTAASRSSVSNTRAYRDVNLTSFADDRVPETVTAVVTRLIATLGQASATGVTLSAYSATQSETQAQAQLLWTKTLTDDTEDDTQFLEAVLRGNWGERIVIVATSDTTVFDVMTVNAIGGYGDVANNLATV